MNTECLDPKYHNSAKHFNTFFCLTEVELKLDNTPLGGSLCLNVAHFCEEPTSRAYKN